MSLITGAESGIEEPTSGELRVELVTEEPVVAVDAMGSGASSSSLCSGALGSVPTASTGLKDLLWACSGCRFPDCPLPLW